MSTLLGRELAVAHMTSEPLYAIYQKMDAGEELTQSEVQIVIRQLLRLFRLSPQRTL